MPAPRIGGSFAPPLDLEKVEAYRALAGQAPRAVREAMLSLCKMVEAFHETPPSAMNGHPHPCGTGLIVPLEPQEVERMDPHIPWDHELDALAGLFEGIDPVTQAPLRNAAFHLLWYARELFLDREPGTTDRVFGG